MSNVLVMNAGSSSLKFQLLNVVTREVYAKGNCERIGLHHSFIGYRSIAVEGKQKIVLELPDHKSAIEHIMSIVKATGKDFIGIGHRVVQGGWYFPESKLVTNQTLGWVREVAPLAPLHNYAEAEVIEDCLKLHPEIPNVIVADTAFHFNIPEKAHRYALPRDVVEKYHIRKYGAHGTSHRYIWHATKELLGDDLHKLVSCHLGSGASLSAISDGMDMDTTMGLTPLDGLMMGTRCGSIDPATVCFLSREGGYTVDEIDHMMNKKSGLLAVSGVSSDARDIERGINEGNEDCRMAFEMFEYKTAQYIMQMAQSMHGIDAIAFSAGIGENSPTLRNGIVDELSWFGVKIDPELNQEHSDDARIISTPDSSVLVLVVPTNEEFMIAHDVVAVLEREYQA